MEQMENQKLGIFNLGNLVVGITMFGIGLGVARLLRRKGQ